MRRAKTIQEVFVEFKNIFIVPPAEIPQIIFYNQDPEDLSEEAKDEHVTTVFESSNSKFKVGKIDCWNEKYFHTPTSVRTQVYQNME